MSSRIFALSLILCAWTLVPFADSLSCGQCERGVNELICPGTLSKERYTVQLFDTRESPNSLFHLKCRYDAQAIDISLISDCDFSTVKNVELQWCPLPNVSFSEMFEQIGIDPENILSLSFTNIGQRHDELEPWHFDGLTNLKVLELKENGFTRVPNHTFDNTPDLRHLMLVSNRIETLPEDLFLKTRNLTKVELQNNGLISLPPGLFANLTKLKNISLWENKLKELQPELLSDIPNLWSLELTHNEISQLDPGVFSKLGEIRKILIEYNNLEALPETVFHGCPNLENLEFNNNRITHLPDEIFRESTKMKRLNFDNNRISQLPEKLFTNMKDLENLKFKRNSISTLPPKLFEGMEKLEVLDIQSNILEELPAGIFNDLILVDTLILQNNSLHDLPDEIFMNCESLEQLYLGYNHLSTLIPTMFPNSSVMNVLDLSNNNLSFSASTVELSHGPKTITIQEYFPLAHLRGLERLLLKNNRITEMPMGLNVELEKLAALDLNNNSLSYLGLSDLTFKSDNLKIDFRNNDIKVINLNHMNFSTLEKNVEIYVADNPLVCNCEMYAFTLLANEYDDDTGISIQDVNDVKCTYPDHLDKAYIRSVDPESLTCKLSKCVENCSCKTRAHDKMFIVDCSYKGLRNVPLLKREHLPQDDDYDMTLILRNNSITNLNGLRDGEYGTLVNLSMPYNRLTFINESYFPKSLEALDISENNITFLPTSFIEFLNSSNLQLSLGNNPWTCDCSISELHAFLRDPDRQILDIHNVVCSNFENEALINLTEEDFCPLLQQPYVIATITAVGVCLSLFAIFGTVTFYKYRQDIRVWLFTNRLCLWAVTQEEKDSGKKYDAFISHSDKDEEFINSQLVPGLENGEPKYKVCIPYRDWLAGEYIQNQIEQSVEASRRTIVVLSSNFIEKVWGHIEFKTAHSKALKDKTNRIIVIVLGEVPPESELDEELKLYLSTRTYLQWKDPKFWEKLRYAMPHPPDLFVKKHKKQKTEKLELGKTNAKIQNV